MAVTFEVRPDEVSKILAQQIANLDRDVDVFTWDRLAPEFDGLISEVAEAGRLRAARRSAP